MTVLSKIVSEYEKSNEIKRNSIPIPPSIYFGGCAWGSSFYVGVFQAMVDVWGPDFYQKTLLCGGSAGTMFALGIATGKSPAYMDNLYVTVANKSKIYGSFYYGSLFMEEALREIVEDPLSYKLLEGRCCIATTAFFARHRWHISWKDNEDLIECSKASCHIPFYCQKNRGLKGTIVVDGAYGFAGDNLPHGDESLYVGIDSHAEITRHFTNKQMLVCSHGQEYEEIVASGYEAFMKWVHEKEGVMNKKVNHRVPNYEALYLLWFLKFFELIFDCFLSLFEFFVNFFKLTLIGRLLCEEK
jgi:hypothetical protein